MKTFLKETLTAILATLVFSVMLCGVFPLIIFGAGQLLFPRQANGSLIESNDRRVIGSEWLGQNFAGAKYFRPRPSAAGANGYDAASSSGSNLGPTSQKLIDAVKQRAEAYRAENGLAGDALIPGDAVTASGSGLDPHISVKNAELQAWRVARERNLSLDTVKAEIARATHARSLGILGEPGVNVLKLNIALDDFAAH
ncbi:MAG TPA: K(+)-transporting ATPase subunit C [Terrimicrobiaceae bacterium]